MRAKPRNPWFLVLGISGISGIAWFVNTYPPDTLLRIASFFLLFFGTSVFFSRFFLNNVRRSILLSLGLSVFFLLRLVNLREPLYLILLIISLVSLEVMLKSR